MKCPLCQAKKQKRLYDFASAVIVQCQKCRFLFAKDARRKQTLLKYYDNAYWLHASHALYDFYYGKRLYTLHRFYLEVLKQYVQKKGKLLDIGPGLGYFMKEATEDGWTVTGIELGKEAVDYGKHYLGVNTCQGDLLSYKTRIKYDAITSFHTFEHVHEPLDYFRKTYDLLKPGGLLLIEVPNAQSPLSKALGKWFFEPLSHRSYFTEETLRLFVEKAGFTVISVRTLQNNRTNILSSIAMAIGGKIGILDQLRKSIDAAHENLEGKRANGSKSLSWIYVIVSFIDDWLFPIKKLVEKCGWGEALFVIAKKW